MNDLQPLFWGQFVEIARFCSVQFSCSVVFNSLQPHELQHARPPCPSPTPGVHPDSRPSTNLRWAETKRKKEFKLEAWENETSDKVKKIIIIMKRQRNTTQMKEQTRNTEVQINEEIGKLPEKEFRIMIVKMIKNFENKMEKMQESIKKDLEELKNKHTNNRITEIKNTLEGINSRISEAEE